MNNGNISWQTALPPSSKEFVENIVEQIPTEGGARYAFETILDGLARWVSDDTEYKLRKLEALESAGVDNWDWYDDAMEDLRSDSDDEGEDE